MPEAAIGFDAASNPVVLGPIGRNVGYLIDSADDWASWNGDSSIAAERFNAIWADEKERPLDDRLANCLRRWQRAAHTQDGRTRRPLRAALRTLDSFEMMG